MGEKHLSSQFDTELNSISAKLLEMGGLVESQLADAMMALSQFDIERAQYVIAQEQRVNTLEVEIDAECSDIIARRQPTARDLRLILAISKATANLERAGDEVMGIARRTQHLLETTASQDINIAEIRLSGEMAAHSLHRALDAFARLDTVSAEMIISEDRAIDDQFRGFVRKLISYLMEDPRLISAGLDFLFIAKAIERIGDHAKNLAELVVYIVNAADIRHRVHLNSNSKIAD